jgi:multiple sugar transport system permease protein
MFNWLDQLKESNPYLFTSFWAVISIIYMFGSGYVMAIIAQWVTKLKGETGRVQKRAFTGWLFASPWISGFLLFVLGPGLLSLYWSFTNIQVGVEAAPQWVGLKNYTDLLFNDRDFVTALINSFYVAIFGVPLTLAAALGMAMLLNQKLKAQNAFRVIFYVPVLLASSSAVLFTWRLMLNANNGIINSIWRTLTAGDWNPLNYLARLVIWIVEISSSLVMVLQTQSFAILTKTLTAGFPGPDRVPLWLGHYLWAKPAVIIIMMWSAGAMMLIYLSALNGVPPSLYEAAKVDGANGWERFWGITWPMIAPSTFYNLIIGTIGTLQIFEQAVTLVDNGGQNQTLYFMAYYLWRTTFRFNKVGYGAAMSWIMLGIVLVLTVIQFRLSRNWVYYEAS